MKYFLILFAIIYFTFYAVGNNSKELNEYQVEKLIKSNFLKGDFPLRYSSNILVQLQGVPTKDDSIIFQELVDTLNLLIDKWDVYLIPKGTSNLIFEINPLQEFKQKNHINDVHKNSTQIISSRIYIKSLSPDTDLNTRKKIIRYHFLRSLVIFKWDANLVEKIPGSVFATSEPEEVTFDPIDFQIIEELYSAKFENASKNRSSIRMGVRGKSIQLLGNIISLLFSLSFLVFIFHRGIFKRYNYQFRFFLKQGMFVVLSIMIFLFIEMSFLLFSVNIPLDQNNDQIGMAILGAVVICIVFGFISVALIYYSEKVILKENDNFLFQVLFPLFTTTIIPSSIIIVFVQVIPVSLGSRNPFTVVNILLQSIGFLMLLAALRGLFIFLYRKSESIIRKKDVELAKLGELHKQAELQSIRSKINPHFLYNSLNSIASLATSDAQKTEQMALALSDFFKYSINREQKQFNSVKEELGAVRTYLEIEKVRFGERLNFEIDCSQDLLEVEIPQLLIQPMVENAIKHGLSKITEKGFLKIEITKQNQTINIKVYDNGPDFPIGPLGGFGIRNTSERLNLMYGNKASINWQNGEDKFIEITLPILEK